MSESFQSFLYCKVPLSPCFTLLNVTDSSVEASNNRFLGVGEKEWKGKFSFIQILSCFGFYHDSQKAKNDMEHVLVKGKNYYVVWTKLLAERGFDPRTSGLWAQHASTAPLCCGREITANFVYLMWRCDERDRNVASSFVCIFYAVMLLSRELSVEGNKLRVILFCILIKVPCEWKSLRLKK